MKGGRGAKIKVGLAVDRRVASIVHAVKIQWGWGFESMTN